MTTKKKITKAKTKKRAPRKTKPRPTFSYTADVLDAEGNPYKYTRLESKFITEYLNDPRHVAYKAAQAAGYEAKSPAVFRVIASQLLSKPSIVAAINRAFESLTMPKFETLFRIGKIAAGDIDDILNDDGELDLDLARERGTTFLIRKIQRTRDVVEVKESGGDDPIERSIIKEQIKVEIHDPLRALEMLGKHGKLFVEKYEHTGPGGKPLIPDGPQVVFYIPDNGRGDADGSPGETERPKTTKQTTRRPRSTTTPDPASRTRARNDD